MGFAKGIKTYRHGRVTKLDDLKGFIEKTDSKRTLADHQPQLFLPSDNVKERKRLEKLPYGHNMRSWAEVCDSGMTFKGTLGAENCSEDEIAAIVLLLEAGIAEHGFKIGTGKALGLGSVESHIKKIWFRKPQNYEKWDPIEVANPQALTKALQDRLPKVKAELDRLRKVSEFERRVNQLDKNKLPLAYPPPGLRYWEYAKQTGLNKMP